MHSTASAQLWQLPLMACKSTPANTSTMLTPTTDQAWSPSKDFCSKAVLAASTPAIHLGGNSELMIANLSKATCSSNTQDANPT